MLSSGGGQAGDRMYVVTSFHLKLSRDVLEDNVKIAIQNGRTAGVAATHVLLEGDSQDLLARIEPVLAEQLSSDIKLGRVVISAISRRPTYFDIFTYANTLGGHVAIANSDVLFPVETVGRIVASGMRPGESCYALTRWNVTPNGIYIQGMTPSPPWPETPVESLRRHQQNFFSYDAYVFRTPIAIPPDMAGVFIGSLGCDTTLGALLKVSGYAVSNPTLVLQTAHFDVKPRSYRSPSSISDLDRNVDALCAALRRPEAGISDAVKGLLDENGVLQMGRIWFGHPQVGKFGRALQRAIGATPWSATAAATPLKRVKVQLDRRQIGEQTFDLAGLLRRIETEHIFIEWELTGYGPHQVHAIDALLDSPYKDEAQAIKQYQWQSFVAPDHLSVTDRQLYADVMALFERALISPPPTQSTIRALSPGEEAALAKRMASLLVHEFEDEATVAEAQGCPPTILMVDPDALNDQGHYLAYDLQLRKAAGDAGHTTSFLLNAKVDPTFIPAGIRAYRLLDAHSWEIASRGIEGPETDNFVDALSEAIRQEKKAQPDRPLIIYMYCGSFEHARLVQEVMSKFDGVGAMIHLFWLSVEVYKSEAYLNTWSHFATTIARDPRIRLTVATEDLQTVLRKKTGVYFDVAPHPSTTFADNADVSKWSPRYPTAGYTPVVLFPGAAREEKGYLSSIEAIRRLSMQGDNPLRCIVSGRTRADTPPALVDALKGLNHPLISVETRALDDREFVDFLARGDILVLPYKAGAFANRPSGILIDAITLGRPIIAIEGTWLGDAVSKYGWGEVVPDDGGASIAAAVRKIIARYQFYLDAIRTSREGYISQHSWGRLIKAIVKGVRPGPKRPLTTIRVVSHERSERIGVDETAVVARLLANRKGRKHLMLDVGAHIGTSAAYFHKLDWTIHCFEPDPANREKLVAQYGGLSNVSIDTRAVSDRPASGVAFFKSEESTGISALHAFRDTHAEANRVDVTTITDHVREKGIREVDFLKIDVEGFDFSVLKGVPWADLKPDVIECEYEDSKTIPLGHKWQDIAEYLRGLGYAVYISEWHPIVRYGIEHDWKRVVPYPGRQVPTESWGNILAFRVDPGYSAVKDAFDACLHRRNAPAVVVQKQVAPPPLNAPDDLTRFKNIHSGKRCFVMGNGPSLNKTDLTKLDGEFVFGCNSIFLLFDRIKWRPTYYTCVDSRVLPDRKQEIAAMLRDNPVMRAFFPTELQDHITQTLTPTRTVLPALPNVSYFKEQWNSKDRPPYSMFSDDINKHVIQPYTVAITMLQIAMYMGFSEIYLIGCDTSYTIPADVKKEGLTERGEVGLGLTSTQDNDPNHFDPSYFGKGRKWHDPQVDKMIEHYGYAKQVAELRGGVKIYNATVGGNLEVFERVEFTSLFGPAAARRGIPAPATNGADAYIRPTQTPRPVASARPQSLTLFAMKAEPSIASTSVIAATPAEIRVETQATSPVQPRTLARAPVTRRMQPAAVRSPMATPAARGGPPGIVDLLKTHLFKRRSGQAMLAAAAMLAIAVVLVLVIPPQGDLRALLFAGGGLLMLGLGILYFAYRTMGFIRRLSAENAELQRQIKELSRAVDDIQKKPVNRPAQGRDSHVG